MPYIKAEDRLNKTPDPLQDWEPAETAGELNYQITFLINLYMKDKVKNYACFNAVVGALECCKLEFARRVINPYEDVAKERNGDVYE